MASHHEAELRTFSVSENLSAKKYFFVKAGATDFSALLNDVAGGPVVGILGEEIDGSSNVKHASVAAGGNFKLKITDTIADGALITAANDGTGVAATGTNKQAPCRAKQDGVTGDIIEVQFTWENKGN